MGIPGGDQGPPVGEHQGVGTFHGAERVLHAVDEGLPAGAGDVVNDHLRVHGGLEDRPFLLEPLPLRPRVHQIAVVGEGDDAAHAVGDEGLEIVGAAGAGGGIPVVTEGDIAREGGQAFLGENVRDEAEPPVNRVAAGVEGDDPRPLLPPVLQRVEAEEGQFRRVLHAGDSDDSALLAPRFHFAVTSPEPVAGSTA